MAVTGQTRSRLQRTLGKRGGGGGRREGKRKNGRGTKERGKVGEGERQVENREWGRRKEGENEGKGEEK